MLNEVAYGWLALLIGGPILLLAFFAWAKFRNRKIPPQNAASERGSRELYDRLNERDEKRSD
jgi:hypothetical protein